MLAHLLHEFPGSMVDVMANFNQWRIEYAKSYDGPEYEGDLETDYLKFLGEIKQAAKKIEAPGADFGYELRIKSRGVPYQTN